MIDFYESCGYLAGILYASSLVPQLYKAGKTKRLDDISLAWQCIFIMAMILSLIYAIHNNLKPVYIPILVELCFMITLLIMKLCYRNKVKDIENP